LLLTAALLVAAQPLVHAQPKGPGGPPPTELAVRGRSIASSDLGAGGSSVSQSSFGFSAEVPFPISDGVSGKLGLSLDLFDISFGSFSLSFSSADRVFVFAGPQWELSAASGADSGDATQWSGTVGAVWLFRPGLTLVGGFVFSERLGYSAQFLPIAGFSWQIDDYWSLALTGNAADYQAPVLKLTRTMTAATKAFAQVGFESGHVRLARSSSVANGYLRYEAFVPQIGVEWRLAPGAEITVFAGTQLSQKYDFKNSAKQYVYRGKADGALVAGLRLSGRF
jgi:hypothetical protein